MNSLVHCSENKIIDANLEMFVKQKKLSKPYMFFLVVVTVRLGKSGLTSEELTYLVFF